MSTYISLQNIIRENNLFALILTDGYNIHYLSGYKGHTGYMVCIGDKQYILTDSRYKEQVDIEAKECICIDIGLKGYSKNVVRLFEEHISPEELKGANKLLVGFEDKHISYAQFSALDKALKEVYGERVELVHLEDKISSLRMVKKEEELEYIGRAEAIGDQAFKHILEYIRPGLTEKDVALELEYTMKKLGAEALSFDTIVASGPNSSLPHAVPTERRLQEGDFLTMDFGCVYRGYCSDMTRTIYIGEKPSDKQQQIYELVLRAQLEALAFIRPGVKGSQVDGVARDIITRAGYGDYFGHGLGHSVGLYIHEEPRCSRKCDTILEEGMTMTVEPGIYLPGEFGVRIEDLVVVTSQGCKNLTTSDKGLICI